MMFADDRSIENLQQLFVEFKKYLKLQKEYTKLEITEKLSILLSALVLLSVVIILKKQSGNEVHHWINDEFLAERDY